MPIQTLSAQFSILSVFSIFAFVLASLLGGAALPVISVAFLVSTLILGYRQFKVGEAITKSTWIGWGLVIAAGLLANNWLGGLWLTPSQDDTLNHLGFLEAILNGRQALLGKINRPGSDWFGVSPYHFYPTGSHAWVALFLYPIQKFGFDWIAAYRVTTIATLALIPGLLWWSSEAAFSRVPPALRFFLVCAASTQAAFPLNALGEGGISRLIAMAIFIPLWFSAFSKKESPRFGFICSAIITPILLFVHPSLLPLLAVATFFFRRKTFFATLLGAPVGAILFVLILRSAPQEVTQPQIIEGILGSIRSDAFGWFERLKGPFHYWFADSMGFGKFLSPKNYWVYFSIWLALCGKIERKVLFLFGIPFLMAALALVRNPITDQLGLIFYHSTKRIAELTPLLGLTLALFAAQFIYSSRTLSKHLSKLVVIVAVAFCVVFVAHSKNEIVHFNELFHSPTAILIQSTQQKLKALPQDERILIDRHEYNFIRFLVTEPTYTLEPECAEVGPASSYCVQRREWVKKPHDSPFWWIPSAAEDEAQTAFAKKKSWPVIEIATHAHLIRVSSEVQR
jgi:hypothetical protein